MNDPAAVAVRFLARELTTIRSSLFPSSHLPKFFGRCLPLLLGLAAAGGNAEEQSTNFPRRLPARRTEVVTSTAGLTPAQTNRHRDTLELPPAPEGVVDLRFSDFFKPIGPLGLEYSDTIKALNGKRVRILGYMVRQASPIPWCFLLSPVPLQLHEREFGLAEDLPATAVHVFATRTGPPIIPFTPGPLLLTGRLETGVREEADGRISSVRLHLDPPTARQVKALHSTVGSPKSNSTTTAPTFRPAP